MCPGDSKTFWINVINDSSIGAKLTGVNISKAGYYADRITITNNSTIPTPVDANGAPAKVSITVSVPIWVTDAMGSTVTFTVTPNFQQNP